MKQETLEEVAEYYSRITLNKGNLMNSLQVNGFIAGAKWQQEQDKNKYSEEDLKSAFFNGGDMKDIEEFNHWFEQFKKK